MKQDPRLGKTPDRLVIHYFGASIGGADADILRGGGADNDPVNKLAGR